jgi:hypothetical protein
MEAARDPELASLLARDRHRVVDIVAETLTGHGVDRAHDRAETMLASFDGILLSALLRPEPERDELLRRVLPLAMHPLGAPEPASLA